jgi:hypothetical protein
VGTFSHLFCSRLFLGVGSDDAAAGRAALAEKLAYYGPSISADVLARRRGLVRLSSGNCLRATGWNATAWFPARIRRNGW